MAAYDTPISHALKQNNDLCMHKKDSSLSGLRFAKPHLFSRSVYHLASLSSHLFPVIIPCICCIPFNNVYRVDNHDVCIHATLAASFWLNTPSNSVDTARLSAPKPKPSINVVADSVAKALFRLRPQRDLDQPTEAAHLPQAGRVSKPSTRKPDPMTAEEREAERRMFRVLQGAHYLPRSAERGTTAGRQRVRLADEEKRPLLRGAA
jgi:hypothetical protein